MQLFDTHCHIHEAQFELGDDSATHDLWAKFGNPDPNHIVAEAQDAGVGQMICVGTTLVDSRQAVRFVHDRPQCWASIGLHPHEAKNGQAALHGLRNLLEDTAPLAHEESRFPRRERTFVSERVLNGTEVAEPTPVGVPRPDKIVAIGECGLDYFYTHSPRDDQLRALRYQIELALEFNLPLIFHVREAFDDFLPIFDSYQGLRGVVHSFTDTRATLDKLLERGLYIGVNGIATFTKDPAQLDMYRAIPQGKLVLETDAPFLTPVPLRGKMNVPANVRLVADFLSDLRGERLETLAEATTHNAQTLFFLSNKHSQ